MTNLIEAVQDFVDAHVSIGEVYVHNGNWSGALECLKVLEGQEQSFTSLLRAPGRLRVRETGKGSSSIDKDSIRRRLAIVQAGIRKLKSYMQAAGWKV